MDAAVWGFVGVVVGGLITGFVTIRAESVRADKEAALDSAKRQDDRRLALDHFQRETLLALQDALLDQARVETEAFMHRLRQTRSEGIAWSATRLTHDLSERSASVNRVVSTLTTRVVDEEVRQMVEDLSRRYFGIFSAETAEEADGVFMAAAAPTKALQERIGELIRATFRL